MNKRILFFTALFVITAITTSFAAPKAFVPKKMLLHEPAVTTAELIQRFEGKWDYESLTFKSDHLNINNFFEIIDEYSTVFKPFHKPELHFGFIEKKDVAQETSLFVRADLHGDLNSLIENLNSLKANKLVDQKYRCEKDVYLIFLGDYVDRGYYNLEVLAILASLKMENPNQVVLIRGNHETTVSKPKRIENARAADPHFAEVLADSSKAAKLERFFETMPLALYVSEAGKNASRQYVLFTHTMVELACDPVSLVDHTSSHAVMPVSKARKTSKRFRKMAVKAKRSPQYQKKVSIERIMELIAQESDEVRGTPVIKSTYSWGNLFDETKIGKVDEDEWGLSPEDVRHSLRLSSNTHSVEMLFRGHDHTYKHNTLNGQDEAFVTTLPVGVTSPTAQKRGYSHDVCYLIKTSERVSQWQKQRFLRAPHELETVLMPFQALQDPVL